MIIGGKGQCRHARVCESVRGPVEEKHSKRVGGGGNGIASCALRARSPVQ